MSSIVTYREVAELARSVEIAGNYLHAAALWDNAGHFTAKHANQIWCSHRADNCRRLHELRKEPGNGNH
ncbi:ANR family transcriptional regulator [Salmonella enterica]|nr:ANR family transcriptional regulator [Salmonella enterica]ELE3234366.1 ANR family transcriptional regulator [Salmonella enterica subsp. enterica serovar Pomona]EBN1281126.1 ANR family transcriptional regulator [Salmonella enterica]EBR6994655.1 ANR family transcriptional regulator [Salmonella enterica]EHH5781189.1 ANR family transcriptional regulator [Salmonella enterica]